MRLPIEGRRRSRVNASLTLPCRREAGRSACGRVARARDSASTTGRPKWRASSLAWLNPRSRRRSQWSGTGTTQSAPSSTSRPRSRISAPRGSARDRQPSYLSAWTIARSAPWYAPAARARSTNLRRRRQRGHRASATLTVRHVASGSPQVRQSGGASAAIDVQQAGQAAPRVGNSSEAAHATQRGASSTDSSASSQRCMLYGEPRGRSRPLAPPAPTAARDRRTRASLGRRCAR